MNKLILVCFTLTILMTVSVSAKKDKGMKNSGARGNETLIESGKSGKPKKSSVPKSSGSSSKKSTGGGKQKDNRPPPPEDGGSEK